MGAFFDAVDASGCRVRLEHPPQRLVSLVPSQTELLADLGLDREVLGITRYCVHPASWTEGRAVVGGTKNPRLDRIVDLDPELVVANLEENTREDVEWLRQRVPVWVTEVPHLDAALAMIRTLGALVDRPSAAETLIEEIATGFAALPAWPPLPVAYLIWRKPWMTVGGDTIISDLLGRGGLQNAFAAHRRYPETSIDALRASATRTVLLSSEPYPFTDAHAAELRRALPGRTVELVDGRAFSWYGSRLRHTPAALAELRRRLG